MACKNMSVQSRGLRIRKRLKEHYDETLGLGLEVFAIVLQGSQNYNLDICSDDYESDVDTKAIILPSFDEFCAGRQPLSTTHIRSNEEHIDLKDIRLMFDTFKKQNVNFVEILFSDFYIVPPEYTKFWERLRELAEDLTHCHPAQTLRTLVGMSCEKRKALCHPYPTILWKIQKWGYDGKQLHHIIRINEFINNYISGMSFKECLTTHSDETLNLLLSAKLNHFTLDDALQIADYYDAANRTIFDKYLKEHGDACDGRPYEELTKIKTQILRQWFGEEINKKQTRRCYASS